MRRATFALALIGLVLAVIALFKENGATDHPLLVQSAAPAGDIPKQNRLFAPCPLGPKNLPLDEERTA